MWRNYLTGCLVVVGIVFGCASTASAESPVTGLGELRFSNYYPSDMDNEPGLSGTPFANSFGKSSTFQMELEVDVFLLQNIGKFGVGASVGTSSFDGKSQVGSEDNNGNQGLSVSESTTFAVYPMRLSAVYLFDYAAEKWGIPLAPIFRGGVSYYLWQVEDGSGDVSNFGGEEGSGGKAGWHVGAGMYFLLDVIDPDSAASFDMNWGINSTYIFAQYMKSSVDGFGGNGFDLSDEQITFGLAAQF